MNDKSMDLVWQHTPRGGYGFTLRIPVTVIRVCKRGKVRVKLEDGREITVSAARLKSPAR